MSTPAEEVAFHAEFAADVRAGLNTASQKSLPSRYLYDALGSALFDAITVLPEYGVMRAEERLLAAYADRVAATVRRGAAGTQTADHGDPTDTVGAAGDADDNEAAPASRVVMPHRAAPVRVVELGSGTGRKTRLILEALARGGPVTYMPIDISGAALKQCRLALSDIRGVEIRPHEGDYMQGLAAAREARRPGERLMVLFLGSTIGNFPQLAATRFLSAVRATMRAADHLLLGADLLKSEASLKLAYDDPTGVTAAFNLNLLGRINRELGANFDLSHFAHEARFNRQARSIEMHLVAVKAQQIRIPAADLTLSMKEGESIWTESSHKYSESEIVQMTNGARFSLVEQWTDKISPFAETLVAAS